MKTAPQKLLSVIAVCALVVSMSGCACNSGCNSWMPSNPFKDRPVRNTIKSWFQGAPCNSCNAPAGQPLSFGTNSAPTCSSCGSVVSSGYAPAVDSYDSGVSLYGDTTINGPIVDPLYGQNPIQNPVLSYPDAGVVDGHSGGVIGEIESAIGTGVTGDGVIPPQF